MARNFGLLHGEFLRERTVKAIRGQVRHWCEINRDRFATAVGGRCSLESLDDILDKWSDFIAEFRLEGVEFDDVEASIAEINRILEEKGDDFIRVIANDLVKKSKSGVPK